MVKQTAPSRSCRRSRLRALAGALVALLFSGVALAQPRIVSPGVDETVHSNSGEIRVVVEGVPPQQLIQALLDGIAASAPVKPPEIELQGVVRGEHVLVVRVVDADGSEVGRTDAVRFYVFHASKLIRPEPR